MQTSTCFRLGMLSNTPESNLLPVSRNAPPVALGVMAHPMDDQPPFQPTGTPRSVRLLRLTVTSICESDTAVTSKNALPRTVIPPLMTFDQLIVKSSATESMTTAEAGAADKRVVQPRAAAASRCLIFIQDSKEQVLCDSP